MDAAEKAAADYKTQIDPLPSGQKVINIKGPVIITGEQSFDLASLLKQAFPSEPDYMHLVQAPMTPRTS